MKETESYDAEAPPVGICLVATHKYIRFAEGWLKSVRNHFLPSRRVRVVGFTDHLMESLDPALSLSSCPEGGRVAIDWIHQEHRPWPEMTLRRFDILQNGSEAYRECSHLFYMDADLILVANVGEEILGEGLTATIHPGFWNRPRESFTYERRRQSRACVGANEGERYYVGAFQGGESAAFTAAMRAMAQSVHLDANDGITAVWHDESHWNRYLIDHIPTTVLDPGYCYPEGWSLPFVAKALALNKNHAEIRSD